MRLTELALRRAGAADLEEFQRREGLYPSGQAGPWCLFCMVLFWQTLLAQSFM